MIDNTHETQSYVVVRHTNLTKSIELHSEVIKNLTPGTRLVTLDKIRLVDGTRRVNCAFSMIHFREHGHQKGFVTITDKSGVHICELTPDPFSHDIAY